MSERTIYEVQQGETHRVRIASPLASTFTATCTATLHRLPGGINSYTPSSAIAATYTVSTFAGDATYGPGFDFVLSAAVTATLDPGVYVCAPMITYTAPESYIDVPDDTVWIVTVRAYPS